MPARLTLLQTRLRARRHTYPQRSTLFSETFNEFRHVQFFCSVAVFSLVPLYINKTTEKLQIWCRWRPRRPAQTSCEIVFFPFHTPITRLSFHSTRRAIANSCKLQFNLQPQRRKKYINELHRIESISRKAAQHCHRSSVAVNLFSGSYFTARLPLWLTAARGLCTLKKEKERQAESLSSGFPVSPSSSLLPLITLHSLPSAAALSPSRRRQLKCDRPSFSKWCFTS